MANRLEPINLTSFVGGLNLRRNQFQLGEDESPDLLNVDIDPRGGFYTRRGWQRWNADDIVDYNSIPWAPRNAFASSFASGQQYVYVVNEDVIYAAPESGVFAALVGPAPSASPHGADFAAWGDGVYIANGIAATSYARYGITAPLPLTPDNWSEYEAPVQGVMPRAEFVEAHAGYMFIACTLEDGVSQWNRIRWSHNSMPDAWRQSDFQDLPIDGGRITGLVSYSDHLLIFKTSGVWAFYGYDEDSWQLVQVDDKIGCPGVTAISSSEAAVYYYSSSDRGGIYAYAGERPVYISEKLASMFEEILTPENVFVSWAGRRLWVSVPWLRTIGQTVDPTSSFVFDPDVGEGTWTMYRSYIGGVGPVIDGSDVGGRFPLAALWSSQTACMIYLDAIDDAYDIITDNPVLGTLTGDPEDPGFLVTHDDVEIGITGGDLVGQSFDSYYRTRWLHAGWPDRKKSWRRPMFICREVPQDTDLIVQAFKDYNETSIHRSRTLRVKAEGSSYWTETGHDEDEVGGFDWTEGGASDPSGTGADWGSEFSGSKLIRAGSLGSGRAMQLRVSASPNSLRRRWGIDAIVAKIVMRRFR
jgi:hypothetical protein